MYTYKYPMQTVTADILVICDNQLLLIKRNTDPFKGQYALPGGHLDLDDLDTKFTAMRELEEELGINVFNLDVKQLKSYSDKDRDPRGRYITDVYHVELLDKPFILIQEEEVQKAEWISFTKLNEIDFAFDHKKIVMESLPIIHQEKNSIIVWEFYDAPKELRDLSRSGGDEDWLVEIPPKFTENMYIRWLDHIDSCYEPEIHDHPTKIGWKVAIGTH